MTTTIGLRTVASITTEHVTFDKTRATEWLASPSPTHAAGGATIADSLSVRDLWPCGWADEKLDKIAQLIKRAIDDDVIHLGHTVRSVELIPCRYKHNLMGARLLVTTRIGVTIASGVPLWADQFTGGARGRAGALAALGETALLIDALMTCYHADAASAPAPQAPTDVTVLCEGGRLFPVSYESEDVHDREGVVTYWLPFVDEHGKPTYLDTQSWSGRETEASALAERTSWRYPDGTTWVGPATPRVSSTHKG